MSSQSPLKRINPETSKGLTQIQSRLDALAEVFINKIATYRNISIETVIKDFGQGDVFVGKRRFGKVWLIAKALLSGF